jgi:ubiquinone/menaquinone biosynthesis C-methylase UbiE
VKNRESAHIRNPHVVLHIDSRLLKAKKIELLLDLDVGATELTLLEIGTGSGGIAHYFANISKLNVNVDAVDVVDNRLVHEGYNFQLVPGVKLPFADETFDVLITNHVIEHVGDYSAQCEHLKEIRRVLKNNAIGYLAVPNRWMLVEPHFKLIFLSWLPRRIRTSYLKFMRKGDCYDCEPLEKYEIEKMLLNAGLLYKNRCIEALKLAFQLEMPNSKVARFFDALPISLYRPFVWLIPTLIYTFHRSDP